MKIRQRLQWTLIIASAFILTMAAGETAVHLLLREPIDRHYWHSLIAIERFIGAGPISLLFGWFYPPYMARVAARKAQQDAVDQNVARQVAEGDSRVRMNSLLDTTPRKEEGIIVALISPDSRVGEVAAVPVEITHVSGTR